MEVQTDKSLYTCTACGAKFSPDSTGGVCPYCRTVHSSLVDTRRRQYLKQQARKRQLKKAAVRLSVALIALIILIVGAVNLVSRILRGNEALIFSTEELTSPRIFYTDSSGKAYFVGKNGDGILIGKGNVTSFCSSEKNKITYFVFEGSRDLDAIGGNSELLLYIDSKDNIRSVAEYPYGKISFVQGGNCDYLYYMINETLSSYQTSSRLYLYKSGDKAPKKLAEFSLSEGFDNFRVSPNGHYLLYKAQDNGDTKLMRYSVKSGSSESLGIKNAEPVSIDNKGLYYSYLKQNESGTLDFYLESGVSDREKCELGVTSVDRITASADGRSFLLESGNLTTIKSVGLDPIVIAARTGSGIGINRLDVLSQDSTVSAETAKVYAVCTSSDKSFFPYYYSDTSADGTVSVLCCEKDGTKRAVTEGAATGVVTNGKQSAFICDNALYTLTHDIGSDTPTLISENFEGYTLCAVSNNGKFIFYRDSDGNLYRIPFEYTGRDWLKIAVDADPIVIADDGRRIVYFADNAMYFAKDSESLKIADGALKGSSYISSDLKCIYYLAESEIGSVGGTLSLYVYDGKRSSLVAEGVASISAYAHFAADYIDNPHSSYVEPTPVDISAQMSANMSTNVNNLGDAVSSADDATPTNTNAAA